VRFKDSVPGPGTYVGIPPHEVSPETHHVWDWLSISSSIPMSAKLVIIIASASRGCHPRAHISIWTSCCLWQWDHGGSRTAFKSRTDRFKPPAPSITPGPGEEPAAVDDMLNVMRHRHRT
jgi:hypothetical protein